MKPSLLTSEEAAAFLGVGMSTIKRWADEGSLTCERTGGGHRRFRREDLERFRQQRRVGPGPGAGPGARASRTEELIGAPDAQAVMGWLHTERSHLGTWWRVAEAVGQAVEEVGARWQGGALTLVEEHLLSERLARGLAWCAESIPVNPSGRRLLLATAEGDEHTLGLSLVELVAREAAWVGQWAGRRTPTADLVDTMGRHAVDAVAVSASAASQDAEALSRQAHALGAAARETGVAVILGGAGPWPGTVPGAHRVTTLGALYDRLVRAA
jgi:excisionase family DNA binding protein